MELEWQERQARDLREQRALFFPGDEFLAELESRRSAGEQAALGG